MTLWGGRFREPPAPAVWEYTTDLADRRLLAVDIEGSIAHVRTLFAAGVITGGLFSASRRAPFSKE